ncbi:cytochrome P450 [Exophiala viscosa]|uniref:Cytochrome P450 n=1 Tax=Exophiala viscosa TaxID=2486360 RepID=A0AAN6DQY1_9EURO|nr:cytochrome P450 [Exophiala viscosa]
MSMSQVIRSMSIWDSPFWRLASRAVPVLCAALFIALLVDYLRILRFRQRLPPGPFPLPIIGNHLTIPLPKPWIAFEKWSQYYNSPLITIWLGRDPKIIVNDAWAACELMEKRADIYSSRPRMIINGDLLGTSKNNQTNLPYGDRWRLHRRIMHTAVGSQAVVHYRDFQSAEAKVLLRDLMEDADDYVMSIERYSISVVSIVGWGRRISRKNDPVAQTSLAAMEAIDWVVPGVSWVESIPELAHLPAWVYPFPNMVRSAGVMFMKYFYALSREGAQAQEENFAKRLLREQGEHGLSNDEVASLTANLIGGGVDTTSSTMISAILAFCVFPHVQLRAQNEIDDVVGKDRMPNWQDEKSLPYITAIVKEALRWRTVTVLAGIPHAPTRDDEYEGFRIPAGTNITANIWAIHRNPRDFPDPDEFRPERYLNGLEKPYPNTRGHNAFGFGRRQCSGQPLAEQGLAMSLARLLWAFDIKPGLDAEGREVKLDIFDYTNGENIRPQPFKVRFVPRFAGVRNIILQEAEQALSFLSKYEGETKVTMQAL